MLLLTIMIRCLRLKTNGKRAKLAHLNKGRKVENEIVEKKSQEDGNCITQEHIQVVETIRPGRIGTPLSRGVCNTDCVPEWFQRCSFMCEETSPCRRPGHQN